MVEPLPSSVGVDGTVGMGGARKGVDGGGGCIVGLQGAERGGTLQ